MALISTNKQVTAWADYLEKHAFNSYRREIQAHFWHHSITVFKQTVHVDAFRAVARGGQGGNAPTTNPFPPPANFRNLANLEEALEKMQCCFQIWPFWQTKLLRVIIYPMCSLAFSLFPSSVLIVSRPLGCVWSVWTVQVRLI